MKIVITDIPLRKELKAFPYAFTRKGIANTREAVFPINLLLANDIVSNDNIKVILLAKEDIEGNSKNNIEYYKKELNEINKDIGANIVYETIFTPFVETKDVHEKLFRDIVNKLEEGCEIYADMTYGPKSLPIVMFSVLNFAEKYFDADIRSIAYGKVDFVHNDKNPGVSIPANPELYEMTSLYYLNSIMNNINYNDSKEALNALDRILNFKR